MSAKPQLIIYWTSRQQSGLRLWPVIRQCSGPGDSGGKWSLCHNADQDHITILNTEYNVHHLVPHPGSQGTLLPCHNIQMYIPYHSALVLLHTWCFSTTDVCIAGNLETPSLSAWLSTCRVSWPWCRPRCWRRRRTRPGCRCSGSCSSSSWSCNKIVDSIMSCHVVSGDIHDAMQSCQNNSIIQIIELFVATLIHEAAAAWQWGVVSCPRPLCR